MRDVKVMPNFEVSVMGPYIQLKETSYINVLNKQLCKSYINADGSYAQIGEKYETEAVCLHSGRAAISYGQIMQTAQRSTEFSGSIPFSSLIMTCPRV